MDTRQHILETAERVLQERGLARVTTRDITRAAGLADGTLYVHFPHLGPCFQYAFMRHFLGRDPFHQSEQEFVARVLAPLLTGLAAAD